MNNDTHTLEAAAASLRRTPALDALEVAWRATASPSPSIWTGPTHRHHRTPGERGRW